MKNKRVLFFGIVLGFVMSLSAFYGVAQEEQTAAGQKTVMTHEERVALRVKEGIEFLRKKINEISDKLDKYLNIVAEKYNSMRPEISEKRAKILSRIENIRNEIGGEK